MSRCYACAEIDGYCICPTGAASLARAHEGMRARIARVEKLCDEIERGSNRPPRRLGIGSNRAKARRLRWGHGRAAALSLAKQFRAAIAPIEDAPPYQHTLVDGTGPWSTVTVVDMGHQGTGDPNVCGDSRRGDAGHSWRFDGDDPYIVCVFCTEMRDALDGHVIRPGWVTAPDEDGAR